MWIPAHQVWIHAKLKQNKKGWEVHLTIWLIFLAPYTHLLGRTQVPQGHGIADHNDIQSSSETPGQQQNPKYSITTGQGNISETKESAQILQVISKNLEQKLNSESAVTALRKINVIFQKNIKETFTEIIQFLSGEKARFNEVTHLRKYQNLRRVTPKLLLVNNSRRSPKNKCK